MEKLFFEGNELSITHPDLCKEWDYEKNYPLTPEMITAGSNKKIWWKCFQCGNVWETSVKHRATKNAPTGCPVCGINARATKRRANAATENNFAEHYPILASEWDYDKNINVLPENCTKGSHKKVWWKCYVCGNEWQAVIKDRIRGTGCPKCSRKNNLPFFGRL